MFRFTVCMTMIGMALASGYLPSGGNYQDAGKYQTGSYSSSSSYKTYGSSSYASAPKFSTAATTQKTSYQYDFPQLFNVQTYEHTSGPVLAAVNSRHKYLMYDAPTTYAAPQPLSITVPSSAPTLNFLMKSKSTNLNVENLHEGSEGALKETSSEDAPFVNRHTVHRPVIQEVYELIKPTRLIKQRVNPVEEYVETLVPKGQYSEEQLTYQQPAAASTTTTTTQLKSSGSYDLSGSSFQPASPDFSGSSYHPVSQEFRGARYQGASHDFSGSSYQPVSHEFRGAGYQRASQDFSGAAYLPESRK